MEKTISSQVNNIAQTLITELSGKNQSFSKKVIDNIFSFVGLAGGVGTSTIVANVAKSLANKNFSVIVLDMNICCPAQHSFFRIEQKAKKPDLISLLSGENALRESIEVKEGVYVLYANNRILFDKVSIDTAGASANLTSVLEQLSSLFDVVLIDMPSNGALEFELTNQALFKSDFIVLVMDENVGCIGAYNRFQRNLSYVGISTQNLKVIMNKRTNITYPASVFRQLDIELEVLLPYDISIVEAGLRGNLYVTKGSSSAITAAQFVEGIDDLRDILLRYGGYEDKKMQAAAERKEARIAKKEQKKAAKTAGKKTKKGKKAAVEEEDLSEEIEAPNTDDFDAEFEEDANIF